MKKIISVSVGIFIFAFLLFSFEVGALHSPYWNGIVLNDSGKIYGFRFAIEKNGKIADGYDTFFIVEEPGTIAPDYSYAEVSFNTNLKFGLGSKTPIKVKGKTKFGIVKFIYGRYGKGVVGYVVVPKGINIILRFYSPWNMGEDVYFKNGMVFGKDDNFKFKSLTKDLPEPLKEKDSLGFKIKDRLFFFYAGFENFEKSGKWVSSYLRKEKMKYEKNRVKFTGEFEGLVSSITTNLYWMKLLQPDKQRLYIPAGRRWIFPGKDGKTDLWTMFEWDSFFNALEVGVEDHKMAKTEIEAVLDTQYKWGNIPNWRSATAGTTDRAQPPVGAFTVLKLYYKTGDINLLKDSYKRLLKFHRYWTNNLGKHKKRDGNNNFLFEWGSDTELINKIKPRWEENAPGRVRAAWESGQDDLPNFDKAKFNEDTNSLELDCIDLSSLVALDAESLSKIADILNYKEDSEFFKNEYEKISKKINETLWNEKKGFYFDRNWNGKFSKSKASSNFYPLLAKVVPKTRLKKVLTHLLNRMEFWGDFVIPTISKDNPAFKDQQYWRGTIWPPTNYLVYQGLKRYRLDEIASEFARKSASLFLKSWNKYRLCRENYNSMNGKGGGQRYQSWGPLFALVLIEDFIENSPYDGLRVGNLSAMKRNHLQNYRIGNSIYELYANRNYLKLYKDGKKVISFRGRAVLRNIKIEKNSLEFFASVYSKSFKVYPQFKSYNIYVDGKLKKGVLFKRGEYKIRIERVAK